MAARLVASVELIYTHPSDGGSDRGPYALGGQNSGFNFRRLLMNSEMHVLEWSQIA